MQPLLSIIVPVYNTEQFLRKCINSILNQTYRNIELIIVNDHSPDNSMQIIKEFAQQDARVKIVEHEQNKGLFKARLSGVAIASGEFVAFVDSDDYVSIDWYRVLVNEAQKTQSDIVMGNTILEDEKNRKYIYNSYYSYNQSRNSLRGEEILYHLMDGTGLCFALNTIWNKVYTKALWNKCLPSLMNMNEHLIMTEDIVFSAVLYRFAEKMSFVNHDGYFYYRHSLASTGKVIDELKLNKNINDIILSFTFFKSFLESENLFELYQDKYEKWKQLYFRWWSESVQSYVKINGKAAYIEDKFFDFFKKKAYEISSQDDNYFTGQVTEWNDNCEKLKTMICDSNIEVISFDIFDTLVLRPFAEPIDLFVLMQDFFENLTHAKLSVKDLRINAESLCRKNIGENGFDIQDVTLDEIYSILHEFYGISAANCKLLMEHEIELEIKFCKARLSAKSLYDLAVQQGKLIILISDMYLPTNVINTILENNGYKSHSKLFLSSEYKKVKWTGDLFKAAFQELGMKDFSKILHIGDNYESDVLKAKQVGSQSFYFPKPIDLMYNKAVDFDTGNRMGNISVNKNSIVDYSYAHHDFAIKCLYAIVANNIFDNPFISYNSNSDYNADPYFLGNMCVGMYLLGISMWLVKNSIGKYNKIHFIARDGYLPKKAYDIISKIHIDSPTSSYIFATRKSLLPAKIKQTIEFYDLKNIVNVKSQTPRSILNMFPAILSVLDVQAISSYKKAGIIVDDLFRSNTEFDVFIRTMLSISLNHEKLGEYQKNAMEYFSDSISPNEATFDLGYSGRLQETIIDLCHHPIDTFYIHTNGGSSTQRLMKSGSTIHSYYDFTPSMSGIINEYILSDISGSCVSYQRQNEKVIPVFEAKEIHYQEKYVSERITTGCTDFLGLFVDTFSDYIKHFNFRNVDVSIPYENFLCKAKVMDRDIFCSSYIEDEIFGGISKKSLPKMWEWQLREKNMNGSSEDCAQVIHPIMGLEDLYEDGLFVALYNKLNKFSPKGSIKREFIKKIVKIFMR